MSYRLNLGTVVRLSCTKCADETLHRANRCVHCQTAYIPKAPTFVGMLHFNHQKTEQQAARNRRRALAGMRAGR